LLCAFKGNVEVLEEAIHSKKSGDREILFESGPDFDGAAKHMKRYIVKPACF
jgi:hypothetical protein